MSRIQVYARVRPMTQKEMDRGENDVILVNSEQIITILPKLGSNSSKSYKLDQVLDSSNTQSAVFKSIEHLLHSLLNGYNCSLFTYGQTGTGKTYTMLGVDIWSFATQSSSPVDCPLDLLEKNFDDLGIIPQSMIWLFSQKQSLFNENQTDMKITVSYIEIYNERILDLLNPEPPTPVEVSLGFDPFGRTTPSLPSLEIRESKKGDISIPGLTQLEVSSVGEVMDVLWVGARTRSVAATDMNDYSSRSHTIFQVQLEIRVKEQGREEVRRSKLSLVDLAGSEKWRSSQLQAFSQERIKEFTSINKSLSALGNCVSALTGSSRAHVPFRDSKLTRLLQDSLGGNTRTLFLVTLSPSSFSLEESLSTLQFADRAMRVRVNATAQREVRPSNPDSPSNSLQTIEELKSIISLLTSRLNSTCDIFSSFPALQQLVSSSSSFDLSLLRQAKEELLSLPPQSPQNQSPFDSTIRTRSNSDPVFNSSLSDSDPPNKEGLSETSISAFKDLLDPLVRTNESLHLENTQMREEISRLRADRSNFERERLELRASILRLERENGRMEKEKEKEKESRLQTSSRIPSRSINPLSTEKQQPFPFRSSTPNRSSPDRDLAFRVESEMNWLQKQASDSLHPRSTRSPLSPHLTRSRSQPRPTSLQPNPSAKFLPTFVERNPDQKGKVRAKEKQTIPSVGSPSNKQCQPSPSPSPSPSLSSPSDRWQSQSLRRQTAMLVSQQLRDIFSLPTNHNPHPNQHSSPSSSSTSQSSSLPISRLPSPLRDRPPSNGSTPQSPPEPISEDTLPSPQPDLSSSNPASQSKEGEGKTLSQDQPVPLPLAPPTRPAERKPINPGSKVGGIKIKVLPFSRPACPPPPLTSVPPDIIPTPSPPAPLPSPPIDPLQSLPFPLPPPSQMEENQPSEQYPTQLPSPSPSLPSFDPEQPEQQNSPPPTTPLEPTLPSPPPLVSTPPSLQDRSKPLWRAYQDSGSGAVYYHNRLTKETTWTAPPSDQLSLRVLDGQIISPSPSPSPSSPPSA